MLKFYLWRCLTTLVIVAVSFYLVPPLAKASSPPSSRPPLLFTQSQRVEYDNGKILTGSNLFRLAPDGASIQLTHFSADELVGIAPTSLSPNQQQVIFSVSKDLLTDSIYRMNLDGSNLTRLVGDGLKGTAPLWSPDGQKIAFTYFLTSEAETGGEHLYVINTDGTGLTRLTRAIDQMRFIENYAWTPDSTQLIFTATLDEDITKSALYQINVDGSNLTHLTEPSDAVSIGTWLPQ